MTLHWISLAAMLVVCGCRPEIGRVIWLVGDSTAAESLEELHFAASARDRGDVVIPVAALPGSALGRDLAYFTGRVASARSARARAAAVTRSRVSAPDVVVVSLGTNDTGDGMPSLEAWSRIDTPQEIAAALDAFIGALPRGVRLIWVLPGGPALDPVRVQHVVGALEKARSRWPNLELLPPDPTWFTGTDEDGVHYTAEGEVALADALIARVDRE